MSAFVIEIQAPTIVAEIEKLITVLSPKPLANNQPLPQSPAELAARQRMTPPPVAVPMPEAPRPTTPVQSARPIRPVYAPAQAAPGAAQTAPTLPTQVYSTAPTTPMSTYAPKPVPVQPAATAGPSTSQPAAVPSSPAPVAGAPQYTIDDLARAASQLMDAGKQQQLIDLLGHFGVPTLGVLPKERFGEFATALRQLGARI